MLIKLIVVIIFQCIHEYTVYTKISHFTPKVYTILICQSYLNKSRGKSKNKETKRVVRKGLSEEVIIEQKPDRRKLSSHAKV